MHQSESRTSTAEPVRAVMACSNTQQSGGMAAAANAPAKMHPKLLMAACHGNDGQLTSLLEWEDASGDEHPTPTSSVESQVAVEIDCSASAAPLMLLQGVTPDGDSALHIVATFGDGEEYLRSAKVIYSKAKHLLGARNNGNSTPLHCAARAGNVAMLSLLVHLAGGDQEGGDGRLETLVRMQDKLGETALHAAIRTASMPTVDVLMTADPCLARVPPDNGTSPLFLAVSLRHYGIARELYTRDNQLSYSGPDGQNALHAAVLRNKEMTELLLGWNKELIKQQDQQGNTPLHFAVSLESDAHGLLPMHDMPVERGTSAPTFLNIKEPPLDLTKQLLEADAYLAYQADNQGSFPIHVAASAGRLSAIIALVTSCSGCPGLRDNCGRTFLHVAVKKKKYDVVAYACQTPVLAIILNKQDNEGNTALHLAVEVGDWCNFACLFVNKQVNLNLPNNLQHTPREVSVSTIPTGLYTLLNSRIMIHQALISAKATCDICRRDGTELIQDDNPQLGAVKEAAISNATQVLGIGLVLIATMTFGATFALPGGYRADGDTNGGTPTLAGSRFFQGFIMANTLALLCSSLAVLSIVISGTSAFDLPMRYMHLNIAIWLAYNSIASLGIAFVLAVYTMIAPVAFASAMAVVVVIASVGALYVPSIIARYVKLLIGLCLRVGVVPIITSDIYKVVFILGWPIILIFGSIAYEEYARWATRKI